MTRAAKKKAQISFEERIVEDPELAAAIETRLENAEAAKAYRDANAEMKERAIEVHGLKPGEALRVGEYVLEGSERSSQGGAVRPYTRTVISKVRADSAGD